MDGLQLRSRNCSARPSMGFLTVMRSPGRSAGQLGMSPTSRRATLPDDFVLFGTVKQF